MVKCWLILMGALLFCEEVFAQDNICVDTLTTVGYFYRLKFKGAAGFPSPVFSEPYYVLAADVAGESIDRLYRKTRLEHTDTSKYLACAPKLDEYLRKKLSILCEKDYGRSICVQDAIQPTVYTRVKGVDKFDKETMIGFSKATITWLHLRILDSIAFWHFNTPYTLMNPHKKSQFYDLYLPLSITTVTNQVRVKHREIAPSR